MSTLKKLLALSLALAMVLALPVFASTYTESKYKDAANINAKCEEAIELVSVLNIMQGDDKGNFNPNGFITRAEVAKMIYVITNYGNDDKGVNYKNGNLFTDVAGHWAEGYINYAGMTKLVQGYGNGKFGPDEPITTAEVAKMLLTTIGYSAEVRGYVGAGWDKNVLSDAAIIGLLKGYDYPTVGYAPRQWVAVMFANAMYALTYENMAAIPYTGMLTSTSGSGAAAKDIITMMEKYFNVEAVEAVAVATDNAVIDGEDEAAGGFVRFRKNNAYVEYKGSGIGAADLGQKYRLYVKDNKVLGKACLSETYEARLLDIKTEVKHNISNNVAANKYVFDFDGTKLTFEASEINALETGARWRPLDNVKTYSAVTPADLYEGTLGNINRTYQGFIGNDTVKAIDTDCDGKIDYLFITNYAYAQITSAGTHQKYGEYVTANYSANSTNRWWTNAGDRSALTFNNNSRLYLADCIISNDTLAKNNDVRVTWSLDEGKYVMDVLFMREDVKYEKNNRTARTYVFGGETYQIATMGFVDAAELKLGEKYNVVYDGALLVHANLVDDTSKTLDAINNNIVLVLDVYDEYSHNTLREDMGIEYMTIDGETHIAVYDNDYALNKDGVDFEDLMDLAVDADEYTVEGRLFRIKAVGKKVVLFAIDNDTVNADFNVSETVADGYTELEGVELDATGATKMLDDYKLVNDNTYFYAYTKKGAEPTAKNTVYGVIKAEELGKGSTDAAYAQVFTKSNGYRVPSAVAGYIFANLIGAEDKDFLIIRSEIEQDEDGFFATVEFSDGTEKTVYINSLNGEDDVDLDKNQFCSYTYNWITQTYDLKTIDVFRGIHVVDYDADSYTVYVKRNGQTTTSQFKLKKDTVIAISEITIEREENQDVFENERKFFQFMFGNIEDTRFVARNELTDEMIVHNLGDGTYTQLTYFYYNEDTNVFYVYVVHAMDRYTGAIAQYLG